jgi:hypothetical protein
MLQEARKMKPEFDIDGTVTGNLQGDHLQPGNLDKCAIGC